MRNKLVYILTFLVALLMGCESAGLKEAPPTLDEAASIYRIGEGDSLHINVWKNTEVSGQVTVRPDGMITVPLVGDVAAVDRSPVELSDEIALALREFVKVPQVTVTVVNAESSTYKRRVRVTGAVRNAITIPHVPGMTVLDLILEAGGLDEFAAGNKALLYRKNESGQVAAYSIRVTDILTKGRLETNYDLLPADVITVPERAF